MKHFLINEDDEAYHVHDGSRNFLVAKKGIKQDLHAKIKSLPKYNEGGVVEPEESFLKKAGNLYGRAQGKVFEEIGNVVNPMLEIPQNIASGVGDFIGGASEGMGNTPAPASVAPAAVEVPVEAAPAPAEAPMVAPPATGMPAAPNFLGQFQKNQAMQTQGIRNAADIQGKMGEEQAKLLEQSQMPEFEEKLKKRMMDLETEREKVGQEIEAFRNAGAEDKIDPNRVWNNMGTGNKILATIGLILGGAGSGGNAANNAALNVLNGAIDRDIKAQAANIDKKTNLYKMNLDRYKDAATAQEMTRMQLNSITQGKIASVAARSNSELAKANAEVMIGQLQNQNMELGQKLYDGQRDRMIKETFLGAKPGQIPTEQAINYLVPEKDRKQAREELETVNGYKNAVAATNKIFDEVKNIGATGKIPFTQSEAKLTAAKSQLIQALRQNMKGQGSLSDKDVESIEALNFGALDTAAKREANKKAILSIIQNKVMGGTPTLTGYKIPVDLNVSMLSPEQERMANWAKANPRDPRAAAIKKQLGL